MPATRRRGPKPKLRNVERVSVLLEGRQLRRVDAYAKRNSIDRSGALRELVNFGLSAAENAEQ
jgi:metal-responsive CopG/Arc/MetJ family transcriptional regulator